MPAGYDPTQSRKASAALGIPDGDGTRAQLREGRIDFAEHRGSGPQSASTAVRFPRAIGSCAAALTGFECGVTGDDIWLGRIHVEVEARKLRHRGRRGGVLGAA